MHSRSLAAGLIATVLAFAAAGSQTTTDRINPPNTPPSDSDLKQSYRVEVLARGLHVPWSIVVLPDRRVFFTERTGAVRVLHHDALLPDAALTIDVAQGNKMGMLGMVADPAFTKNHLIYLAYDYRKEPFDPNAPQFRMRIVRYREKKDRLVDPTILLDDIPAWSNHTGSRLRFGPDGFLYITTGDANEPPRSQQLDTFNGKILRVDAHGKPATGNPFAATTDAHAEIWTYGHRNPQGIDFQPGTGRLLESEHGPLGGDEVNWIDKGTNYGWPVIDHRATHEGMRPPLLEFSPSIGPGDTHFYRGNAFPELRGDALVACLRGEGILRIELNGDRPQHVSWLLHHTFGRIRSIAETPEGYLYLSTSQQDPDEGHPRPGEGDDLLLRLVPASVPASGHPEYKPSSEWLQTLAAEQRGPAAGTAEATIARKCASCHGPHLREGMPPAIVNNGWVYPMDDAALARIIQGGIPEKGMPAAPDLTAAEVTRLIAYLRGFATQH